MENRQDILYMVIPCYNEQEVLPETSKRLREKMNQLKREGKIGEANRMLGRPFALSGFVRMGNQIGRTLKMPTINVPIDPCVIELQNGVYASKTEIDGEIYESITNIGTAPTFQEKKKISETFILNFHQDVYNKTAKIFLYHFLRGERKFSGPDELVRTIKGDIERCAQYY